MLPFLCELQRLVPFLRELHETGDLALETPELRGDDHDVREHPDEDDEIGGRRVLLGRRHASSSRSSRSDASRRLPASSIEYSVTNRLSIAARQTQKVRNCGFVML